MNHVIAVTTPKVGSLSFFWWWGLRLVAVLAIGLTQSPLQGADPGSRTLFVATNGSDAEGITGAEDQPFLTIGTAVRKANDGDIITVRAGRYDVTPGYPADPTYGNLPPIVLQGRSNLTIQGDGGWVEIYGPGRGVSLLLWNCTNIVVRDLVFRGNRPRVQADTVPPLFPSLMLFEYNTNVLVQSCQFIDFGNHAISHLYDPKASEAVTVRDCLFRNGGDLDAAGNKEDGAAVSGIGSGWIITNNIVVDCVRGFEVEGGIPTAVSNVVIRGNVMTNTTNLGVMLFANSGESWRYRNILIADNRIYRTLRTTNEVGYGILIGGGQDIVISNNLVRTASDVGIAVIAQFSDLERCMVVSNVVEEAITRGVQVYQFGTNTARQVTIRGNRISFSGESGILAEGEDILVEGNECRDNGAFQAKAGIELNNSSGRARRFTVRQNVLFNSRAFDYQDFGVLIDETVVGAVVTENQIGPQFQATIMDLGIDTDFGAPPRVAPAETPIFSGQAEVEFPEMLSESMLLQSLDPLVPAPGFWPYDLIQPMWEQGATVRHWVRAPTRQAAFHFEAGQSWSAPPGTVWMQHFTLPWVSGGQTNERPVETRLLVQGTNGIHVADYRWDSYGSNARQVAPDGEVEEVLVSDDGTVPKVFWRFPGERGCVACHSAAAGSLLGFCTAQLQRDVTYADTTVNQLRAFSQRGFLQPRPPSVDGFAVLEASQDASVDVESRVRSYLDVNCASCHQPGGVLEGGWDARFATSLETAGLIQGPLVHPPSDQGLRRMVVPGSLETSELYRRLGLPYAGHAGKALPRDSDPAALVLVSQWITDTLVRPWAQTLKPDHFNARLVMAHAAINPRSSRWSAFWFEWGVTTNYGVATPKFPVAPGTNTVEVAAWLAWLEPWTQYHYRIAISNEFGTTFGEDQTLVSSPDSAPWPQPDVLQAVTDQVTSIPAASLLSNDTDPDNGDSMAVVATGNPSAMGARVQLIGGVIEYEPPAGFRGVDEFLYTVADASGLLATTKVTVTVVRVNWPPVATEDAFQVADDATLVLQTGNLLQNDQDPNTGDVLTVTGLPGLSKMEGVISRDGERITYVPKAGFVGEDSFEYTISDLDGATATSLVRVVVTHLYRPPTITEFSNVMLRWGEPNPLISFQISVDKFARHLEMNARSSNQELVQDGMLILGGGGVLWNLRIIPVPSMTGTSMITVSLFDGTQKVERAFSFRVLGPPQPWSAMDDEGATEQDSAWVTSVIGLLANDVAPEEERPLEIVSVGPANVGAVSLEGEQVTYRPPAGFVGSDTFVCVVRTATGREATSRVHIEVEPKARWLSGVWRADRRFELSFVGAPLREYLAQVSADLLRWEDYQSVTADDEGLIQFNDTGTHPVRFYRVIRP